MGISFSDYINRKRVNYAILLMRTNPQMTIYEIADLSGFSSDKSTATSRISQANPPRKCIPEVKEEEVFSLYATVSGFAQVCRGCWADALHPHGFDASLQRTAEPPLIFILRQDGRSGRGTGSRKWCPR